MVMSNKKILILLIIVTLLLSLVLSACSTECTVAFDTNGGTAIDSQIIAMGTAPVQPADPTKEGYVFVGWVDSSGVTYDFYKTIASNVTIYAMWAEVIEYEATYYTVVFDTNGGSDISPQLVVEESTAEVPTNPTLLGYTFDYWSDAYGKAFSFDSVISEDTTIYAQWTANTYTVTFTDGSDNILSTQTIDYLDTVVEPNSPTMSGYNFVMWVDSSGNQFDFDTAITADLTLVATWAEREASTEYTVAFDSNGGSDINTQIIQEGKYASMPIPSPTQEGYVFDCWLDSDGNEFDFESTAITDNIELTAQWEIAQYTVSFVSRGGSDVLDATVSNGDKLDMPSNPTRDGYTFVGWVDYNNNAFDFDNDTIVADTTLYAEWTVVAYTITFYQDADTAISTQPVAYNGTADCPNDPSLAGYQFVCWLDSEGNEFDFEQIITSDTSIYASWTEVYEEDVSYFTVSFDSDDGTLVASQAVVEGNYATLPTPAPTKTGYTFSHWIDGDNNIFVFSSTAITADTQLFAVWEINTFTVSFTTNTTAVVTDQTIEYGSVALSVTPIAPAGYEFAGWTLDGKAYDFDSVVTEDISLVAVWSPIVYTVTFDDGSGNTLSTQTVNYEGVATQPNNPTMSAMTFVSWCTSDKKVFDFSTIITDDIVLYATWRDSVVEYTVSFSSDGTAVVSQIIVEGSYASMPSPAPTKDGYTFAYWVDSITYKQFDFDSQAITEDTTLIAIWSVASFTVAFETAGGSAVSSQTVAYNNLATMPVQSPVRSGYMFDGWVDKYGNEFDFANARIVEDTTIYANWLAVSVSGTTDYHEGAELTTITITVGGDTVTWTADLTDGVTTVFSAGTNVYSGYYTLNGADTYLELTLTASACVAADSYVIIKNATCDEMGIEVLYCTICGTILDTQSIPMLEHDYSILVYTEGDCCNYGYTEYVCSLCDSYMMDPDNPEETYKTYDDYYGEHSWETNEDGTVQITEVTPPTCCDTGVGYRTCSICGYKQEDSIPTIPHDYSVEVVYVEGTCCTRELLAWTCAYCGAYLTDEDGNVVTHEGDYGEHNYVDGQCTICGAWAEGEYVFDIGEVAGTVYFNVYLDSTNSSYYVCTISGSGAVKSNWLDEITISTKFIQSLTIMDGITSLPENFMNNAGSFNSLTTVEFETDDITEIPEYCFAYCTALVSVTYPTSLVSIGGYAFIGCNSLEWTTLPDSLMSIGYSAFGGNAGLGDSSYFTSIDYVDLSNTSVTYIADYAFYTSSVKYVILPSTITTKFSNSFFQDDVYNIYGDIPIIILGEYDASLTYNYRSTEYFLGEDSSRDDITVWDNGSVTFSTYSSFIVRINQNCAVTEDNSSNYYTDWFASGSVIIYCPSTISNSEAQWLLDLGEQTGYPDVVMISGEAFYSNYNLTSLVLPDSLEVIGHGAFACAMTDSQLISLVISENSMLHDIGDYAFYGLVSLTSIYLPQHLTTIGYMSFAYTAIADIYYDCIALTYQPTYKYDPDSDDPYTLVGKTLFPATNVGTTAYENLLYYIIYADSVNITFGSHVEIIYENTFRSYENGESDLITSLDFTNATSLHTIGNCAFMGNNAVTEIDLSNTQLTYWAESGSYTFGYMEGLTTVYMPAVDGLIYGNMTATNGFACIFQGCSSLSEIYLTGNITAEWVDNVGVGLFSGIGSATNPVTVYIDASVTSLPQYLFCGLATNYINFVIAAGSQLELGEDYNVYYGDTVVINTNGSAVMTVTFE